MQKRYDVIVVGGNHNGLTIALMLAELGLSILILEQSKGPKVLRTKKGPARLLAIADRSFGILKEHGVFKDNNADKALIEKIVVLDEDAHVEFHPKEIGLAHFGIMIDEFDLSKHLNNAVMLYANIHVQYNTYAKAVEDGNVLNVDVEGNAQRYEADLIIAADGKNSRLRSLLGIETFVHDYKQTALVFDIVHEEKHHGRAMEIFLHDGPLAILPKHSQYESSIVWTAPYEDLNTEKWNKEIVAALLSGKISALYGDVKLASDIGIFNLTQIIAKQYYAGSVICLGDALHAIHPLAGQGYNLSIRDAKVLYELIKKQVELGLEINSILMLEEYQRLRVGDNTLMAESMRIINSIFSSEMILPKVLRRTAMSLVNNIKPIKNAFMYYAVGD